MLSWKLTLPMPVYIKSASCAQQQLKVSNELSVSYSCILKLSIKLLEVHRRIYTYILYTVYTMTLSSVSSIIFMVICFGVVINFNKLPIPYSVYFIPTYTSDDKVCVVNNVIVSLSGHVLYCAGMYVLLMLCMWVRI